MATRSVHGSCNGGFALAAVLILSASLVGQKVYVVAPSGGNFQQIDTAIQAAKAGDRIEVRPGTYRGFRLGKRLAIVGTSAKLSSGVTVVAGAQGAELAGLDFAVLSITGVKGPLFLRDLTLPMGTPAPRLSIQGSGPVHITRLRTLVVIGTGVSDMLTISSSSVYFKNSWVYAGGYDPRTGTGFRAALVTDSSLVLAGSKIYGAAGGMNGASSCFSLPVRGPGGVGVHLLRSTMRLIAGSEVRGGFGSQAFGGKCGLDGAAVTGAPVHVSVDSKVTGAATVGSIGIVPKLELVASLARGTTGIAQITYPSGKSIASYFSVQPGHFRLPGFDVPVLLDGTVHWFDTRTVTGGKASIPIPIPNVPQFRNLVLYFQSVGIAIGGGAELSNSTGLWVR